MCFYEIMIEAMSGFHLISSLPKLLHPVIGVPGEFCGNEHEHKKDMGQVGDSLKTVSEAVYFITVILGKFLTFVVNLLLFMGVAQ